MKVLLITAAGLSSRFSESLGHACLKCIYHENSPHEALLYRMIRQNADFDCYVVVGGFCFDALADFIHQYLSDLEKRIVLVKNEMYETYGSGYSLYLGLQEIMNMDYSELVFAEGDLYIDTASFCQVCTTPQNAITYNRESIRANKAVAFYFDIQGKVRYIYDTCHNALEIKEPFTGIFNSGQIWKFVQPELVRHSFSALKESDWIGTNLVFIQHYFGSLSKEDYALLELQTWINCNTITDFRKMKKGGTQE